MSQVRGAYELLGALLGTAIMAGLIAVAYARYGWAS